MEAHPAGQGVLLQVCGKQVACPICGETGFAARKVMLNTRKLTFFNLDFLNKTATIYRCLRCSHVLWFED
ncbi:MAG: hypothetical protein J0L64_05025 [Acidobacteria bacterium]|nr:hypothetical protein [Acidobacteriota bacterium]